MENNDAKIKLTLGEFLYSKSPSVTNNGKTYDKETVKNVLDEMVRLLIKEWEVEDTQKMKYQIKDTLLMTPVSDFLDRSRQRNILNTYWSLEEKSYYKLTLTSNKKIKEAINNLKEKGAIV